jgi:hypothetical protein
MGHRQIWINSASPKVPEMAIVEIWRQLVEINVIQLLNVIISTT